jgi:hypothetical protein
MRKIQLLFLVLFLFSMIGCPKRRIPATPSSVGNWSTWESISSFPLKSRQRRLDDLGGGNFAWEVQIRNSDLTILNFTLKIEVKKADGSIDVIEKHSNAAPGDSPPFRLGAASITRITAIDVRR